jgi:hypothetical protein
MIDITFIEFYIKKKYSQKLEEYFDVTKSIASTQFYKRRTICIECNKEQLQQMKKNY